MNVFKLLSRSSNPAQSAPAQRLPSSGAVANPQLFGHDEQDRATESSKSRKRKRGQNVIEEIEVIPADLDFFGEPAKGSKRKRKGKHTAGETEKETGAEQDEDVIMSERNQGKQEEVEDEPYNEDECKRILRSHKLKIVVLEDFAAQEQELAKEEKKKKKKSKKRKLEEEAKLKAKKKDKRQLFPRPLANPA